MIADDDPGKDAVPAVTRAVAILDALAAADATGLSVSQLARALGIARSSTANLCATLVANGLIAQTGGHYRLGHRLLEFGSSYLAKVDQVQTFYDLCAGSPHLSRQTARLALLDGTSVVYLARYDGTQPLRLTASIGDRFPASVTATGKAMLATLPVEEVRARYRGVQALPTFTDRSLATVAELERELDRVRDRGYAMDDEETTPDVLCFAVPVRVRAGAPAGVAVSATIHRSRDSEPVRAGLVDDLRRVAAGLASPLAGHVESIA
jgi:DNA-binding IclR family transcriptional regulator